jgi:hypothetical protein
MERFLELTMCSIHHHQSLRTSAEVAGNAAPAKHIPTLNLTERHIQDIGEQSESDMGILVEALKSLPKVASI